jgi:hypothetical protein
VYLKALDDIVVKPILVHPGGDLMRRPSAHFGVIEMSDGGCDVVVLSSGDDSLWSALSVRSMDPRWLLLLGDQRREL